MKKFLAVAAVLCALAGTAEAGIVRFFNGSPGAPALDLFADAHPLQTDVGYASAPDWNESLVLPDGPYSFSAVPSGGGDPLAQTDFDFEDRYTVAAAGPAESMELLFLHDIDHQSRHMSLRFINLSPDSPPVDLVKLGGPHVLFEDIGYKQASGFDNFGEQTLDLGFRDSATGDLLLELPDVFLGHGRVYTVWLLGYTGGQEPALQAVVTNDAAPSPGTAAVALLAAAAGSRRRR